MSELRLGCVGYLPRKGVGHTESFLTNLANFPTKHPLYLYSHEYKDRPGVIALPANAEDVVPAGADGRKSIIAINNAVFFTGVAIAGSMGLTHMLYVEIDCRFGAKHWDEVLFNEFLSKNRNAVCAGTPVIFNPASYNRKFAALFEKYLRDYQNRPIPMSMTGSGHLGAHFNPCLFPNGALAIYSVEWLLKTFPEIAQHKTVALANSSRMWDMIIGEKLFAEFKEGVFEQVVCLEKMYSGYMDVMTSPEERKQMLDNKTIVAVHQVKDNWIGPAPEPAMPEGNSPGFNPSVEILIVTFKRDIDFLKYCLRSIKKFATGFAGVTVVVPKHERASFLWVNKQGCKLMAVDEQPETGFLNHMACKCEADLFCTADYILHLDADTIFKEPVTPLDYFNQDRPVLLCRPYASVRDKNHAQWQSRASNALGSPVTHDFMVTNVLINPLSTYPAMREFISGVQGKSFRNYVMSGRREYPTDFAEHPTIGAYAAKFQAERYCIVDIGAGERPPLKTLQSWSKSGIDFKFKWQDGEEHTTRQRFEDILK